MYYTTNFPCLVCTCARKLVRGVSYLALIVIPVKFLPYLALIVIPVKFLPYLAC
jgi:hypothetical protein